MKYEEFLKSKEKTFIESGFEVDENDLNPLLKDFQKYGVTTALRKGRFAFFFDCGLGKTFCQLEWSLLANDLSQVQKIVLIHLSDSNSDERKFKKVIEEATGKIVHVANNNQILEFNKNPF